jgi:carbonic anhydrase
MKAENHEGLLVLGVLVKLGAENEEMAKIINSFNDIRCTRTANISQDLKIKNLFPSKNFSNLHKISS